MNVIPAIPTKYNGVQFRSRLEARWAAFFDLMAWPWEYEPIDLAGYIPDFILRFDKPLLIEVKPLLEWPCPVFACSETHRGAGKCIANPRVLADVRKVQHSGWSGEAVLVGAGPWRKKSGDLLLGRFIYGEIDEADAYAKCAWLSSAEPFFCNGCDLLSFCSDTNSFHCRVSGCYDGDAHKDVDSARPFVVYAWREAGNRVQWRGVEARP